MTGDSNQFEISLPGIDESDLQKFLEALYGEFAINERSVEGIILLAVKYDTKILIKKCERFLMAEFKKTLKKKMLEMSVRYNLIELKNKCLGEVETLEDIQSVLPNCIDDLNPSLMASLFKKTLALQ